MKKLIGFLVLTLLIAACTKPTTGVRAIPQEPTLFTDSDLDSASLELANSTHEAGKTEEVISAEVSRLPALTQGGSASLSTQAVLPNAAGFLYYIEQNPSSATQPWRIYRFDQYNKINTLVYAGTRAIQAIAGSEDGKGIAVSMRETSAATSDYEIYKLNLNSPQTTRLTSNSVDDTHVSMSADTAVIVWEQPNMGRQTIVYRKHNIENVLALRVAQHQPSVSSNGRYIVLTRDLTGSGTQVYRYDLINQSYAAIPVSPLGQPLLEHPSISDDGRHIAYLQGGNQLVFYTLPESSGLATSQVIVSGATLEHPFLTADAQFVTYGKPQNNSSWLYIKSLATGTERLLTHPASPVMHLGMMWVMPFATQQILPLHSSIEPSVPSRFDYSIAMSENILVAGVSHQAIDLDQNGFLSSNEINVGAVYLYYRNSAGNWDLVKQLLPPAPIRLFGRSVAISGNTLVVVGLHQAVIYQKDQGGNDNWGLVKILNPSNGLHSESGSPAALAGDTLVIGAAGGATDIGTAYVFQKDQGGNNNWGEVKILVPSDGAIKDQFGSAVAISGNTIVVGAYYHGKAYIFERDQGGNNNWGQVKKLIPSVSGGGFGNSVAIDQDRVVVGSYFQGFLFARNQNGINNWGEVKILSTYGGPISVSISGETVAVGDPAVGSVYIHKKDQGGSNNWGVLKGLVSLTATGENFGNPIVLKNNRIGVWAPGSLILESASAYEPFFPTLYVFE